MKTLYEIIKKSFSRNNGKNSETGESDLVALLINSLYAGTIIKIKVPSKTHYCNVINGEIIDYSDEVLEEYELDETSVTQVDESELLDDENTKERYLIFLRRVLKTTKNALNNELRNEAYIDIALKSKNFYDLEIEDFYDGGAYEMVSFFLASPTKRTQYKYIRDKEDDIITLTTHSRKEAEKNIPLPIVRQIFDLARENKETISTIKHLEKVVRKTVNE